MQATIDKLSAYLKEKFIAKDVVIELHGSVSCLVNLADIQSIHSTQHEVIIQSGNQNFTIWTENLEEVIYEPQEFEDDEADLYIGFKDGLGIWFNIIE